MPLDIPSVGIRKSRFGLKFNTITHESPLSGDITRSSLPGARWMAEYTFPATNDADMALIQAFLIQLRGRAETFNGYDPDKRTPLGTGNGTPLVNGADQTGRSLITDGWANSETVLKAGDYFSVNGELKQVTADVTSDGSGNATITFEPALRAAPADNAALTTTNPTCTMILASDEMASWDRGYSGHYNELTIAAMEVFS